MTLSVFAVDPVTGERRQVDSKVVLVEAGELGPLPPDPEALVCACPRCRGLPRERRYRERP